MKKGIFLEMWIFVVIAIILHGCGGGGGDNDSASNNATEYVVENISLSLTEADFWSNNGSAWEINSREIIILQDGSSFQSELKWQDALSIQAGDQFDFSFEGEVVDGGEVTIRIVSKIDGKTKAIYAEKKFLFSSGKNVIPPLIVDVNDNQASVVMLFGEKSGCYKFLTNINIKRTRIKTDTLKLTPINISEGEFKSDSGSTWDSENGIVYSVLGSQRASTKLEWGNIPIRAGVVFKIKMTGYSTPVSDVVIQLRSSNQTVGEKIVELYGEEITVEIIPTMEGESLRFLFGLSPGIYQLKDLKIEQ